jgi:hypothetical protein
VALAATVALAAGSALWRGQAAALFVSRVSMIAPTGVGLEGGNVRLQGNSAASYSISVPWRDGDLRGVDRNFRFGSPFAAPAGSLAVTDDRPAGRMRIDGLAVGRHGSAGVTWMAAVERQSAEASARGDRLTITNPSTRSLRRAVVRIGNLCGTLAEVPAGASRAAAGRACTEIGSEGTGEAHDWPAVALTNIDVQAPPAGAFVIAAETDEPFAAVEAAPAIQVTFNDVLFFRGPLAEAGSTP